jgi:hypothetical protein
MTTTTDTNKPIHVIRSANNTSASVWQKADKNGEVFYTVNVDRSYKKDGTWHRTNSFRHEELPMVRKLYAKAEAWLDDHLIDTAAE